MRNKFWELAGSKIGKAIGVKVQAKRRKGENKGKSGKAGKAGKAGNGTFDGDRHAPPGAALQSKARKPRKPWKGKS